MSLEPLFCDLAVMFHQGSGGEGPGAVFKPRRSLDFLRRGRLLWARVRQDRG